MQVDKIKKDIEEGGETIALIIAYVLAFGGMICILPAVILALPFVLVSYIVGLIKRKLKKEN